MAIPDEGCAPTTTFIRRIHRGGSPGHPHERLPDLPRVAVTTRAAARPWPHPSTDLRILRCAIGSLSIDLKETGADMRNARSRG